MKRVISLILSIVMILSMMPAITVSAAETSGSCGENLTWTLDEATGTLTISGTGDMDDFKKVDAPWDDLDVQTVVIEKGVTSIGESAFPGNDITSVTIADTVTRIGQYAFSNSRKLTSITIPDSVTEIERFAFQYCGSLRTVDLGKGLTTLGDCVFDNCQKLQTCLLPDSITDLGASIFCSCYALTTTSIPEGTTTIGASMFWNCVHLTSIDIPDSVTVIDTNSFRETDLATVDLPQNLTTIGSYAFSYGGLTQITIPNSVTSIGYRAFYDCNLLTEITFPEGITEIPKSVCASCDKLTAVHIPASVTTICNGAFSKCTAVTDIYFGGSEAMWNAVTVEANNSAVGRATIHFGMDGTEPTPEETEPHAHAYIGVVTNPTCTEGGYTTYTCSCGDIYTDSETEPLGHQYEGGICTVCHEKDPDYVEPSTDSCGENLTWALEDGVLTVSGIGEMTSAPWNTDDSVSITKVVIEEGVTSICDNAFNSIKNISTVTIADTVTSIGDQAFYACDGLGSVTLPSGLTYIGRNAFSDIYELNTLTVTGDLPVDGPSNFYKTTIKNVYISNLSNWILYSAETSSFYFHNLYVDGELVKDLVIPEDITSLGNNAFDGMRCLESVTIHGGVTSIGQSAFWKCINLKEVKLSEGITTIDKFAFSSCQSLTSLTLPASIQVIGSKAFSTLATSYSCGLKELTFTGDAPEIASNAFIDISATVYYPGNNATWTSDMLQNYGGTITWVSYESEEEPDDSVANSGKCGENLTWTLKDGVLTISGTGAMYDFDFEEYMIPWHDFGSDIQTVIIEEGVTSIGDRAFWQLGSMTKITIADTVTSIGDSVFYECFAIEEILIPEAVTSIGASAFSRCDSLKEMILPEGITQISAGTFYACNSLTSLTIPAGVTSIGNHAFYYSALEEVTFKGDAPVFEANSVTGEDDTFLFAAFTAYYPAGNATWTEDVLQNHGGTITWVAYGDADTPEEKEEVSRLAGSNRWDTAIKVADQMKENLGLEKFDAIIIASGDNFADALAGSYLSAVKSAPILLCWNGGGRFEYLNQNILDYIDENLAEDGTVYILGGKGAVPMSFDEKLGSRVNRLNGSNRFETNLMILKEAGVKFGEEILVCTSTNFADSLSASATGKPILLVFNEGGKLFDNQKEYLATLSGNTFTILGGEGAVSEKMAGLIGTYGATTRLAGASRFETSVLVAEKYFSNPDSAVLAYAWNYPDGLCGGGLAYSMNAPLILTMTKYETRGAKDYIQGQGIGNAVVLGGTGLISDDCVKNIFGTAPTTIE